jgi:hypothetical protein
MTGATIQTDPFLSHAFNVFRLSGREFFLFRAALFVVAGNFCPTGTVKNYAQI